MLSPRLRKAALTVHIAVSVGWFGAVLAYIPLDATAWTSEDPAVLRAAYVAMELIARQAIVPLALATVATGLVVSLGTRWGLFRHYWVLFSFTLTVLALAVLLVETQTIAAYAAVAADPASSGEDLRALGTTLPHSVGGLGVLLVVLVLNVVKPPGRTRRGRRAERGETVAEG